MYLIPVRATKVSLHTVYVCHTREPFSRERILSASCFGCGALLFCVHFIRVYVALSFGFCNEWLQRTDHDRYSGIRHLAVAPWRILTVPSCILLSQEHGRVAV